MEFVKKCAKCRVPCKPNSPTKATTETIPIACPFDQWGIDILGPFQWLELKKFIIVAVEYFSKWIEAEASGQDIGNRIVLGGRVAWSPKLVKPRFGSLGSSLSGSKSALKASFLIPRRAPPKPSKSRQLFEVASNPKYYKYGIEIKPSLANLTCVLFQLSLGQTRQKTEIRRTIKILSKLIILRQIHHLSHEQICSRNCLAWKSRNSHDPRKNVVKFIKNSSVLRPGYYIGIDMRKKLVILGIRGTHTVYDLLTDIISSGHEEITFEGYSTHFGTAEAARWFLNHEMDTIRKCLEKHKGFRLRLLGHSLGGATASLLAIKLRKKSIKELGFSPDIVTAVGYATPPCVSKELAESCSDFVTTVVMQDDIVPRLSVASLTRLRNEIVETDWVSVFSREDWKGVIDLVTNAKQVVSSVQDVARKLAEYAKFREMPMKKEVPVVTSFKTSLDHQVKHENPASKLTDDLFVPGTLYYLKRNEDGEGDHKHGEYFTLLRRNPGEHFQRILLSSNLISDHKCDSHYYALRDVLKGLPSSLDDRNIN
ncbi:hypothetical protein DH2020_046169 [Rehmannia glutinosa]|uniref:Fungal lipase-type domain-containing protein n=1 Tax=Rehmannia glutinosa TaxID=99300 RepID=A0ABR0UBY3_REHGL